MPPLQGLKKEIPIPSSYHPHPALPLPRHEDGGISDKGEGLGGGEKWDFLYYELSSLRSQLECSNNGILGDLVLLHFVQDKFTT